MTLFRRFQLELPGRQTRVYRLSQAAPGNWLVQADEASMRAIAELRNWTRHWRCAATRLSP